jgi:hypothetical protein
MIIHSYIPKRKPKKPNAKQRAQKASWQALLKKYDITPSRKAVQKSTWVGPADHPHVLWLILAAAPTIFLAWILGKV